MWIPILFPHKTPLIPLVKREINHRKEHVTSLVGLGLHCWLCSSRLHLREKGGTGATTRWRGREGKGCRTNPYSILHRITFGSGVTVTSLLWYQSIITSRDGRERYKRSWKTLNHSLFISQRSSGTTKGDDDGARRSRSTHGGPMCVIPPLWKFSLRFIKVLTQTHVWLDSFGFDINPWSNISCGGHLR